MDSSNMNNGEINILLVEDNEDHSELIGRMLLTNAKGNERVHVVQDGRKALEYLRRFGPYEREEDAPRPDLIFLDIKLPRVSGLEVLEEIKNDVSLCTIPVIILTTSNDEYEIARCYELGANSYICKPTDFRDFVRLMQGLKAYWFEACLLPDKV